MYIETTKEFSPFQTNQRLSVKILLTVDTTESYNRVFKTDNNPLTNIFLVVNVCNVAIKTNPTA